MQDIRNVYCLFEQSGTFKNEFKKFGINAYDLDICNDFKETDFILDLFVEIEKAYNFKESIFDMFTTDDILFAFFPCIRFEMQFQLVCRCNHIHSELSNVSKLMMSSEYFSKIPLMYDLFCKLFIICIRRNLKLVVENPYCKAGILSLYFPIKPSIIDYDRSFRGDYYVKPTQYWFINFEPSYNLILESIQNFDVKKVIQQNQVNRSMISDIYANRFIREFIL